jgi:3-hydroxyisobutyrate dehydrogenase
MLADAEAVLETMEGDRGALAGMSDGAVWAQMSTVGLAGTERLAALAAERGVDFVDAPVLGTRQPADEAKLVVLASGPEAAVRRCARVFEAVAGRVMSLGETGEGTRLKVVVNEWILGIVENVGETIAFAQAVGVDPRRFLEAIDGAAVGSPYAQVKGRAILEGSLQPSFTLRLARKDIGLVLEAAERHGVELPLAATVARQFDRAIELGHGEEDMAATYFASAPDARAG